MQRILGVDYGERRMGLALSDPLGMFASPLRTVHVTSMKNACAELISVVAEVDAGLLIIGMPFNMNGSKGEMAEKVDKFIELVKKETDIPVKTVDERLSSQLVEKTLLAADMSRGKRKKVIDKLAAQVILQSYMDSNCDAIPY
jgi:putative Holliday junction resolvase